MDIEKDIIQDQKETIHRLQEECKEKTDIIMALGQEKSTIEYMLHLAEQENAELKERKDKYYQRTLDLEIVVSEYQQALEEIREILKGNKDGDIDEMIDKINEVLGNE